MKKVINLKRIVLLTLLFVLGTTTMCFADVYVYVSSPIEDFAFLTMPFLGIALIILAVVLDIDLVCMGVGKINNSEELISKTKNVAENLFYYILILLGLISATGALSLKFILSIIPLIAIFISIYLRLKSKNKKASYLVIGIYLALILLMLLPELKYMF